MKIFGIGFSLINRKTDGKPPQGYPNIESFEADAFLPYSDSKEETREKVKNMRPSNMPKGYAHPRLMSSVYALLTDLKIINGDEETEDSEA